MKSWLLTCFALQVCLAAPLDSLIAVSKGLLKPVHAGCFTMGTKGMWGDEEEKPAHKVCLDAYKIDSTEVTQCAYGALIGSIPQPNRPCDSCPVVGISWFKADAYCKQLGKRLPTEAEWEYAARGGKDEERVFQPRDLWVNVSWHKSNTKSLQKPCLKPANALGLCDMTGNAWEWTSNWDEEYSDEEEKNPKGPLKGKYKVLRGGSWSQHESYSRPAQRGGLPPADSLYSHFSPDVGFRCASD